MERRKFLKQSLSSVPVLLFAPSILSSCSSDNEPNKSGPESKRIVIVGSGISGLAAASKLKEKGYTVTVLESQDKIGGRLRTNRSLGIAFDEGASWIHGIDGNPITALAQQAGMTTFFTDDDSIDYFDLNGTTISDTTFKNTEKEFYAIMETLKNRGATNQSFEEVFKSLYPDKYTNRLWKFFLSTYVTFDRGDLKNLSSLLYDEGEEYNGIEKIATNGYDTIPTYLAKGLDVQLNQRVTKINYTGATVNIEHNGKVTQADYVLVTVPLGVLKANTIQFVPALNATKQTAIEKVGMNCVNKFLLTWDRAFWDDVQYIVYTPEERDKFNYFVNVKKFHPTVNGLMTFAYADSARLTESQTDAQVIESIMVHLRDIYGSSIPNPTNLVRTKWQTNTNSFGAYSYTAVGTEMRHFDDLAQDVNGKVFFAGEHTNSDYFSTAHGAYQSGIREADKIIKVIGV